MGIQLLVALLVLGATGYDAFPHFNFGIGARELATGGAGTANCRSASALYWNPAALARLSSASVLASYNPRPMGSLHEPGDVDLYLGWSQPLPSAGAAVGIGFNQFALGGIEWRDDETKKPDATVAYYETVGQLAAALNVLPGLGVGGGLLLYLENMTGDRAGEPAAAIGGTAAVDYAFTDKLRAGLTVRSRALAGGQDLVAYHCAVGAAYRPVQRLLVTGDLTARQWRGPVANLGAEYDVVPAALTSGVTVAARAGFKDVGWGKNKPASAPTVGLGFGYNSQQFRVVLDYALVMRIGGPFGNHHILGLSVGY
jgi:hypothetical protein